MDVLSGEGGGIVYLHGRINVSAPPNNFAYDANVYSAGDQVYLHGTENGQDILLYTKASCPSVEQGHGVSCMGPRPGVLRAATQNGSGFISNILLFDKAGWDGCLRRVRHKSIFCSVCTEVLHR